MPVRTWQKSTCEEAQAGNFVRWEQVNLIDALCQIWHNTSMAGPEDDTVKPIAAAKPVEWNKAAKKDLMEMPVQARRELSLTLKAVQYGETPDDVSPFEGSRANNVMKIKENHDGDTYRLVYAAKFDEAIWVSHAFKKKSNEGIATPQKDIDVVWERYKQAEIEYKAKYETEAKAVGNKNASRKKS